MGSYGKLKMNQSEEINLSPKLFAILFGAFNIYPIFLMIRLHYLVPKQKELLDDLLDGAPLPGLTEFVLGNYQFFWILPIISILILVLVVTMKKVNKPLITLSFVSTFAVIFILQNITYEAALAPMLEIIQSL